MTPVFPPVFEARMRQQLAGAWDAFVAAHATPPPVSIRLNPRKPGTDHYTTSIPWCATGRYLQERPVFTLDPALHAGAYYVQEASSMFLEQAFRQIADTTVPLRVLDLCAAPGGKSTHISSLLSPDSLLVSNEVIRARAGILAENLQKWGNPNSVVTQNDPEDFAALQGFFDVMVVDAPCSGEGLFRKDPEAMAEWSEDNVQLCSARQRRILSDVWPALKTNGLLVYSTCTYNRLENEENLAWLRNNHDIEFIPLTIPAEWGIETVEEDGIIGYRFAPHRVHGEGFFLSVIRKRATETEVSLRLSKPVFAPPSKKILEQVTTWVQAPEDKSFLQREDLLQFVPAQHAQAIAFLSRHLHLVTAGTFVATLKHDKLIPEHALALSTVLNQEVFPALPVSYDEAIQYLRKETLPASGNGKGFAIVVHNNLPLGWVNQLPNRLNNLYPSAWRIRMGA
jgi:16S rRNA C967 or C1407 C5-methylase (RsmB/RsmF family)